MADFEINKRLSFLIKEIYKTSPYAFSQKYGDNGGVKTSQIIRERNGLSTQMLGKIIEAYPEINQSWLLTGEGEMLKGDNQSSTETVELNAIKDDLIASLKKQICLLEEVNSNLRRDAIALKKTIADMQATAQITKAV